MQIIGEGASLNPLTNELYLPQTTDMYWHFIDNNGTGDVYAVNGGNLTVSCPCKKITNDDYEVAMQMDGCLDCVAAGHCMKCSDLVIEDTQQVDNYPYLMIRATSVTFAIE
ncbi:MAG: hypothetical protein M0R38_01665 [Bacteroidia bacterium]|nr:hypothetical protein [Bacteroidia bacterium]